MDWFRAYHGTCTDPKLHRVARSIHVSRGLVIAGWLAVLETASANTTRGNIGDMDEVSLAFMIDVKPHVGAKILDAFRAVGMLDGDGNVAAWTKRQRQSDDAGVRKRKFRERDHDTKPLKSRKTNASRHGTNPQVEQNRTEQIETPNGVSNEEPFGSSDSPDFETAFREFYAAYPRKVGPQKAAEKYRAALKRASHAEIMDGLRRAKLAWERKATPAEYIPHPATWLHGGRWEDDDFVAGNGSADPIGDADRMTRTILRKMNGHECDQEFAGTHSVVSDGPPPSVWSWPEDDGGTSDLAEQPLHRSLIGPPAGHA